MPYVFISYRRDDTAGTAGRIYDRLVERFGREHVYRDVDSGEPGEDFIAAIRTRIEQSDVLLAIIGPQWLTAADDSGARRLAKEDDLVRVEVATALERGIRVVPVLVQGATMPRLADLPPSLVGLAQRNAAEVRDTHFDQDVSQLLQGLAQGWHQGRRLLRTLARPGVLWLVLLAASASGAALYLLQPDFTAERARVQLANTHVPFTADAFVAAAKARDAPTVKLFLKAGMDPDALDARGDTALQWAAAQGDLGTTQVLLDAGAKSETALAPAAGAGQAQTLALMLQRPQPRSALEAALVAGAGQEASVRLLLDRGVPPDVRAEDGRTPLMQAAERGASQAVALLVERGADARASDARGAAALHYATTTLVAARLLEAGAEVDARARWTNGTEGWTPLLIAAKDRRWDVVRLLLDHGAAIDARAMPNDEGDEHVGIGATALMTAAREGDLEVVRELIARGADLTAKSPSGRSALSFACEGSPEVVAELLSRGARIDDATRSGWTPLMYAADRGDEAIVRLLLAKGANANAVEEDGWPALMIAASGGRSSAVRALLEGGARTGVRNRDGKTALDIARAQDRGEVAQILRAHGAR